MQLRIHESFDSPFSERHDGRTSGLSRPFLITFLTEHSAPCQTFAQSRVNQGMLTDLYIRTIVH